ncbi:unnamed protein product [Cladocopium goreaui]|uniref:Ubiquitin-like domain-containing protein n=1 Tax=Cladocopium goreaui TaxID=2562237 RepID=A0A9P1FE54_9DINO|nr:unnamed protein product [Cladocopium goreaui]
MGASPSGTRLGAEPSDTRCSPDAVLVSIEVVNGSTLTLQRSHTRPEHCAASLPASLESHAVLRFPVADEVFISYVAVAPGNGADVAESKQHFSLYATVENGGPLGLCQLHLAASLCDTPRGPQELRPQVARNGRLGSSSWRGRLNPRSCQLTLTAETAETASTASEGCARQQFLDALEVRKEVDGTVLAGCVVTGQRTVATRESGTGATPVKEDVDAMQVEAQDLPDPSPSSTKLPAQDGTHAGAGAGPTRRTRSGAVAMEAQRALKAQREKLERERREEEMEREMKANCTALIALQDSEYHRSLLHDQLQDLRKEQQTSEASREALEVDLEKAVRQQNHEATEAQEAEDTLRRRLVELTQRLVELKESCRNTNGTGRYWKKIMAV